MGKREDEMFEYCKEKYSTEYLSKKTELEGEVISANFRLTSQKVAEIETASQLHAIKESIVDGMKKYPDDIAKLWADIYKVHLYRKSGISNPVVVEKAIKAEQSWRSSSGHAFEQMIKELGTLVLEGTGVRYILQKDLNTLLKAGELANDPADISWLKEQIVGDVFDLYVVADCRVIDYETNLVTEKPKCFGCVQCKTSIRDRVSRDREPSVQAMQAKFWSIAMVLDGTMLSVPKYTAMVNGDEKTSFKKNGWHGVYVLSWNSSNDDRIYGVDVDFRIVREHTLNAFEAWQTNRQGYTPEWRAEGKTGKLVVPREIMAMLPWSTLRLACGPLDNEHLPEITDKKIRCDLKDVNPLCDIVATAEGESMDPRVKNGDKVVIRLKEKAAAVGLPFAIKPNGIVAVSSGPADLSGSASFALKILEGQHTLKSLNPRFPPIELEDGNGARIIGVFLGVMKGRADSARF